ncbi:Coiled-coil domain-containing protein -like protein [Trichinella spiralis]|uniref:DNA-directed primase/polymerase protein n=1 Tax=Trichinella spiralis TaxID=6334 RepID=A0A0V1BJ14_TRISP|nr:Coiled-coil domain-containing protein -like protein [Trichinella spiralis]
MEQQPFVSKVFQRYRSIVNAKCSSFYGQRPKAPSNGLLQRIEDSVKKFKEHPLVSPRRCSLHDDKYCWKIFRRQNEALTYLKSCSSSEPLKLFCFESISMPAGCRTFLISTVSHFWNVYKNLPEFGRHCYEVIREATRCRLYFDLEFYFNSNPSHNGEQCVQIFVSFLCERIHESFGIECTYSCIVDLDASTEKKFSRHLIVHLPENAVFEDNLSVGNFVKDLCARLKSMSTEERRDRSLEQLFVINDDGQETLICDLGVYTRNRNFRLFLSSKMNQKNPLKLAKACEFYTARGIQPSEQEVFFDSLIEVLDEKEANVLACTSDKFAHSVKHAAQQHSEHSTLKNQDGILEGRHERSPFPEIDCFFEDYLQRQNPAAAVRSWIYFKNCQQLLLAVNRRFRYCHRIGREHRRNHIMYMVDLKRAVFYQKCFDPDCQAVNYRSNDFVLPDNVAQSIRQTLQLQEEQQQNATHTPSVASSSGSHWTLLNESTTDEELLALIAHYELVTYLCMICKAVQMEKKCVITLPSRKASKATYLSLNFEGVSEIYFRITLSMMLVCQSLIQWNQLQDGHEVDCMISKALLRQSEFHVIPCNYYRGPAA